MTKFNQDRDSTGRPSRRPHNTGQDQDNSGYVGAPYNFIDFPRCWIARYDGLGQLPPHDRYGDGLVSGSIELEWEAETPVFIKQGGQEGFFRNHEGFAIPGSSTRGMIRSHVQVLGMCNYRDDIEDLWFLYRDMARKNQRLKEQYRASLGLASHNKQVTQQRERGSLPDKLKAGYVEKGQDGNYYIIPAQQDDKGAQIYRVSERHLKEMKLPSDKVRFMYNNELWEKDIKKLKPNDIHKDHNINYAPYYVSVYYAFNPANGKVGKIVMGDAKSVEGKMQEGYLLSSGYIPGKLNHYIIRAAEENVPGQAIDKTCVDAYNTDLVRKKYKGNETKDQEHIFYHLPEKAGERKPVFYVEIDGKVTYFGFTPYLRVFYDRSVHQGIPPAFRSGEQLDYSKSLFGFSFSPPPDATATGGSQAYKSRLSFGDMQAVGNPQEMDPIRLILATPKATAYPLYLKQSDASETGALATYNSSEFKIRGMKRYWFKKEETPKESDDKKNDNIASSLRPLPKGTCFKGRIRFSNLAEDELGLLLWSIMLEPESRVQIGMGKPYGYGRMKLKREKVLLEVENLVTKYGEGFSFAKDYLRQAVPEKYIQAYQEYMQVNYQIDIRQELHVQSFFQMSGTILANEQVRYMEIRREGRNNEYKDLQPLSSPEEVIEGRMVRRIKVTRDYNKSSNSYKAEGNKGENKNHPSKIVTGRETPKTDKRNKPQVEALLPWQLKLQSLQIDTDKKKGK